MQTLRDTDPRRIGPYEVLGRLGAGDMGEVYLAEPPADPPAGSRPASRQEVRAARAVGGTGTYVARIIDADTEAERTWTATEFVDGPNLFLGSTTLRVIDRQGRQTRSLSFNSKILAEYSPVISTADQGLRVYVATPNGITAPACPPRP
ncbi:hypothetical protein HLK59_26415 [Streptomyces sp. S3(2020)]|uniref:hypothetical protein n=1 Tax=Streptomyces sp. S3(2020) TaxID=2732044 RepID=UPI0014881737|nr:hypothetical protein [Streptomyces sp. S3(2020)]NNN33836.1 hypothetical protein [Streptomyces sp. S3(2020)]